MHVLTEKSKIKKMPLLGIEPATSRSSVSRSANCASKESGRKEISEVSFVSCPTSHVGFCSFLESIEHDFIKALMIETHIIIISRRRSSTLLSSKTKNKSAQPRKCLTFNLPDLLP